MRQPLTRCVLHVSDNDKCYKLKKNKNELFMKDMYSMKCLGSIQNGECNMLVRKDKYRRYLRRISIIFFI